MYASHRDMKGTAVEIHFRYWEITNGHECCLSQMQDEESTRYMRPSIKRVMTFEVTCKLTYLCYSYIVSKMASL